MTGSAARSLRALAVAVTMIAASAGVVAVAGAQTPDSLTLQQPQNVKVWRTYSGTKRTFNVYLTWQDISDQLATYIHQPDTSGWAAGGVDISIPQSRGIYTGDIDRTVAFRCLIGGQVGADSIRITFEVRKEENFNNTMVLTPNYVPGTWLPLRFRDQNNNNQIVDFGIEVSFPAGNISRNGVFLLGAEDFEGFHIWRGIEPDGSDLEIIGELSKEEAHIGDTTGGSIVDSVYYHMIVPDLRATGTWFSPFGPVDCLGSRLDIDLEPDGYFWFDCNAFNGFTYYYAVTTFDSDYLVSSGRQGLVKRDNCAVVTDMPFECQDELKQLVVEVDEVSNLSRIYAVPNPFRTGGSRLTVDNYHNFPDGQIRFVNVPPNTTLKVFTVSGDLVWEYEHVDPSGNVEWNATNRGGQEIGSGVYIYRAESATGEAVYGRLVVIR